MEQTTQGILWASGVVAFVMGAFTQSALMMLTVFGVGVVLCVLVVCPPWTLWARDRVQWVPQSSVDAWLRDEKEARELAASGGPTTTTVVEKDPPNSGIKQRNQKAKGGK